MSEQPFGPLAVMGGGNMAQAILRGGLAAGRLRATDVMVCDPEPARRSEVERLGVRATDSHNEALRSAADVLLAVKPQSFPALCARIAPLMAGQDRLVISILAGAPAAAVHSALGAGARVVRVMPNTPALVGKGMAAVSLGPGATADDGRRVRTLFEGVGATMEVDESLMDAATAVAGSGPAYVFLLAEAMTQGAGRLGFTAEQADTLVRRTIEGAGALLSASAEGPDELRARVTSKGGTTAAATDVLERRGVPEAVVEALTAARDRGAELSRIATDAARQHPA